MNVVSAVISLALLGWRRLDERTFIRATHIWQRIPKSLQDWFQHSRLPLDGIHFIGACKTLSKLDCPQKSLQLLPSLLRKTTDYNAFLQLENLHMQGCREL